MNLNWLTEAETSNYLPGCPIKSMTDFTEEIPSVDLLLLWHLIFQKWFQIQSKFIVSEGGGVTAECILEVFAATADVPGT
jgi:hypothetical protein